MKKVLITALLFVSVATYGQWGIFSSSARKNYYVSSDGNDSNNGRSAATPWKTIAKVNASTFKPGDVIHFAKGDTFRETLTVPSSGTSKGNIVFTSYGTGNKPIISGADLLTDWTDEGSDLWSAHLDTQPVLLMIDGVPARLSRFPYPSDNHSLIVTATSDSGYYVTGNIYSQGVERIENGTFYKDTIWTKQYGATISGGKLHGGVGTAWQCFAYQPMSAPAPAQGDIYKITFTISNYVSGRLTFGVGAQDYGDALNTLENGTYAVYMTVAGVPTTNIFYIHNGATTFYGDIDDVKVCKVTNFADNYFVGSKVCLTTYPWSIEERIITASSGANRTLTWETELEGTKPTLNTQYFYIENKKELINAPLQWAFADSTVYLKVEPSHTPADYVIEASVRDNAILSSSRNYVTIRDIKVTGTQNWCIYILESIYNTVTECTADYVSKGMLASSTQGITVTDNTVTNVYQDEGIRTTFNSANPIVITGNTVTDIASDTLSPKEGEGINVYQNCDASATISNNTITRTSQCGIEFHGNGCAGVISGNTVTNAALCTLDQSGIYTSRYAGEFNPVSVAIKNNNVKDITYGVNMYYGFSRNNDDGNGIYIDDYATNVTASYNRVYNIGANGFLLHNCNGNFVYNNTVYKCGVSPMRFSEQTTDLMHDNIIKNNVFANTDSTKSIVKISRDPASTTVAGTFDNNLYFADDGAVLFGYSTDEGDNYTNRLFGAWKTFSSGDASSVEDNPDFTSSTDFHLQVGSPAINAGADVGLTQDYEGNPIVGVPDIGAYEKQP